MYDIKQLENDWKEYRKKKLKPWYLGGLAVLILMIPTAIFLMKSKMDFSEWKHYFESSKEVATQSESVKEIVDSTKMHARQNVLIDDALDRLEIKENVIDVSEKVVKPSRNILVDIPVLDDTKELFVEERPLTKNKIHLEIIESTSVTAYQDVEKRFLESHDIDDALFLARSYYQKGDYEKAVYWALEINKLDEDLEEGLLIFVKSKAKMGRKNEAISILTTYEKRSGSQKAKKLLYQIENNKL